MVDDPVTSWDILWDEKYKDSILMQDSVRDAFSFEGSFWQDTRAVATAIAESNKCLIFILLNLKMVLLNKYYAKLALPK